MTLGETRLDIFSLKAIQAELSDRQKQLLQRRPTLVTTKHAYARQRKFTCIYADRDPASPSDEQPPAKKRTIEGTEAGSPFANESTSNTPSNGHHHHHPSSLSPHRRRSSANQLPNFATRSLSVKEETPLKSPGPRPTIELANSSIQLPASHVNGESLPLVSRGTTVNSGPDEEAVIYSQSRMLQDPTGRVLYIGDSATLSFLQLLRMMVETVAGSSPFTHDPRRHKIVEGQYSLPPGYRHVCDLAMHVVYFCHSLLESPT